MSKVENIPDVDPHDYIKDVEDHIIDRRVRATSDARDESESLGLEVEPSGHSSEIIEKTQSAKELGGVMIDGTTSVAQIVREHGESSSDQDSQGNQTVTKTTNHTIVANVSRKGLLGINRGRLGSVRKNGEIEVQYDTLAGRPWVKKRGTTTLGVKESTEFSVDGDVDIFGDQKGTGVYREARVEKDGTVVVHQVSYDRGSDGKSKPTSREWRSDSQEPREAQAARNILHSMQRRSLDASSRPDALTKRQQGILLAKKKSSSNKQKSVK